MNGHPQQVPLQISMGGSQFRSLQNKNTKNLSISIKSRDDDNVIISTTGENIVTTNNDCKTTSTSTGSIGMHIPIATRPSLLTRRSEASIYSASLTRSFNSSPGVQKPSFNHFVSPTSKTHNFNPIQLPKNNSVSLSINTQLPKAHSRSRSRTIDTSTPLFKNDSDIIKTPLQLDQRIILSGQRTKNTTCIFPEATSCAPSIITTNLNSTNKNGNNLDTSIYENINVKDAYPNGPLLVIPPNIYLYSEPTLHEILDFDLIINVAEEIPNLQYMIPPECHRKIDYYHIEWSHQSKIVNDLNKLTNIMHKATLQNKKILIHCQCGVSRSASLMVAYIMRYCNMSLNDAYNKLKSIAKDISPNMGLIFQLMEWSEKLSIINDDGDDIAGNQANRENKLISGDVSNDSSINTSLDLTPKTPFVPDSDHNLTILDIQ